jgi:hypothetical protein
VQSRGCGGDFMEAKVKGLVVKPESGKVAPE